MVWSPPVRSDGYDINLNSVLGSILQTVLSSLQYPYKEVPRENKIHKFEETAEQEITRLILHDYFIAVFEAFHILALCLIYPFFQGMAGLTSFFY